METFTRLFKSGDPSASTTHDSETPEESPNKDQCRTPTFNSISPKEGTFSSTNTENPYIGLEP